MEISVAEPEKRVVTSMKVQDTFIVYLVETRLVFCVVVSTVQNCMFTHDRNSKWFFYEVYFFLTNIKHWLYLNMYMVNFFILAVCMVNIFFWLYNGLNYIWFTESQIRILSTTGMGRRLYGDATASLSCYRITCLSPIPTSLSLLYPKKR